MKHLSKQHTIFIILCTKYMRKKFLYQDTELFKKKTEYIKFIKVQNI